MSRRRPATTHVTSSHKKEEDEADDTDDLSSSDSEKSRPPSQSRPSQSRPSQSHPSPRRSSHPSRSSSALHDHKTKKSASSSAVVPKPMVSPYRSKPPLEEKYTTTFAKATPPASTLMSTPTSSSSSSASTTTTTFKYDEKTLEAAKQMVTRIPNGHMGGPRISKPIVYDSPAPPPPPATASISPSVSLETHCRILQDDEIFRLQNEFQTQGVIVIPHFFNESYAKAMRSYLENFIPNDWYLSTNAPSLFNSSTNDLEKRYTRSPNETLIPLTNPTPLTDNHHTELLTKRWTEAGAAMLQPNFLAYRFYRTIGSHGSTCNCILCGCQKFVSTATFLEYIDMLTSVSSLSSSVASEPIIPGLTKTTAVFASRYRPGCFLGTHGDNGRGKVAFVWNLTTHWHPMYGGSLTMLENDWRTVKRVVDPEFNSLVLFRVEETGTPHYVSYIPDCITGKERWAISGWFQ